MARSQNVQTMQRRCAGSRESTSSGCMLLFVPYQRINELPIIINHTCFPLLQSSRPRSRLPSSHPAPTLALTRSLLLADSNSHSATPDARLSDCLLSQHLEIHTSVAMYYTPISISALYHSATPYCPTGHPPLNPPVANRYRPQHFVTAQFQLSFLTLSLSLLYPYASNFRRGTSF